MFWTPYGTIAVECKDGKEVLKRAEALLKAPHSAERILRCWGAGMDNDTSSFAHTLQYIVNMLQVLYMLFKSENEGNLSPLLPLMNQFPPI